MFILSQQTSIANQFLAELRDKHIQMDRMRFRKNLERLGEVLAFEVSKTLTYQTKEIQTPLEKTEMQLPADQVHVGNEGAFAERPARATVATTADHGDECKKERAPKVHACKLPELFDLRIL